MLPAVLGPETAVDICQVAGILTGGVVGVGVGVAVGVGVGVAVGVGVTLGVGVAVGVGVGVGPSCGPEQTVPFKLYWLNFCRLPE